MSVAIVGEDLCLVSACTLGLASLLHPLRWVCTILPVLPSKYSALLDAPVPFLVGLPASLPNDQGHGHLANNREGLVVRGREGGRIEEWLGLTDLLTD